jgi:hypothetical protein
VGRKKWVPRQTKTKHGQIESIYEREVNRRQAGKHKMSQLYWILAGNRSKQAMAGSMRDRTAENGQCEVERTFGENFETSNKKQANSMQEMRF